MNKIMHPIEPEELMAYLDGELSAEQAAATHAHLEECEECKAMVGELRAVSDRLKAWHVLPTDSQIRRDIAGALAEHEGRQKLLEEHPRSNWRFSRWPTLAWAGSLAAVGLIIAGVAIPNLFRVREYAPVARMEVPTPTAVAPTSASPTQFDRLETFAKLQEVPPAKAARSNDKSETMMDAQEVNRVGGGGGGGDRDRLNNGPMIIRTADLQLVTKEFDKARAGMEAILKKHRGYVGDLKVGGATGSGRTLTSALRVPADQLEATLTELKTLGRVESESQGGQDVTSPYVDLQARLANARNTEKRMTDLLSQRTGKLSDVLEVEQEVDRVRGEIEQMEVESKQMTKQVSFATVNVTISEDYKAQLEVVPPSTATRLSNAAVEGYRSMVDGVVGVMLFALSNGPSVVLWVAVLFLPARFAWKTMRRKVAQ